VIEIVSGTNRPGANALRIARLIERLYAEQGVPARVLNLQDLPRDLFDPTSYAEKPAAFGPIQDRVLAADGIHIVTPEYNGGFPGVLKYFIDMLKFPQSFEGRPVAFVGEAAGVWGAIRPVEMLQLVFGYRNAHIFPVRVFIDKVHEKLDADGNLTSEHHLKLLREQTTGFADFTRRIKGSQA
jgi:NAD(P)H-dependent FMN reductase